jgi:hypothetical protein
LDFHPILGLSFLIKLLCGLAQKANYVTVNSFCNCDDCKKASTRITTIEKEWEKPRLPHRRCQNDPYGRRPEPTKQDENGEWITPRWHKGFCMCDYQFFEDTEEARLFRNSII